MQKRLDALLNALSMSVGIILLLISFAVFDKPTQAAVCRSTPSCIWNVEHWGCIRSCTPCIGGECCYYEYGWCADTGQTVIFYRCSLGNCN